MGTRLCGVFLPGAFMLYCGAFGQTPADPQARLEHIRKVNLERATSLPSFVADEKAVRYKSSRADPPQWKYFDTIESELVVRGVNFTRQNTRLEGKAWKRPNFPVFTWSPDFGWALNSLFDSKCNTVIEFDGPKEAGGKPGSAYRFHAAPGNCFGSFFTDGMFSAMKSYNPPWTGRFLAEEPGASVIRVEFTPTEFPKGFPVTSFEQIESWDYVDLGENRFLLPVATEIFETAKGELWHVIVEYKNHRHFEASTNVTFH